MARKIKKRVGYLWTKHFFFFEQLAKEREEEQREAQAKEESLKAKKKSDPNELKAYSKGVGKFLNPAIKKAAR